MQRVIAERTAQWGEQDEIDLYHEARAITFHVAATALAGIDLIVERRLVPAEARPTDVS